MSLVTTWAIRIAEEAVPDEVELAPSVAEAFSAGGADRRMLFSTRESVVGGFTSGGIVVIMPYILQSLALVAQTAFMIFSTDSSAKFLDCVTNGVKLLQTLRQNKTSSSKPLVPAEPTYAPLRQIVSTMTNELRAAGLGQDEADLITFRVLKVLLEKPQEANEFVQELAGPATT